MNNNRADQNDFRQRRLTHLMVVVIASFGAVALMLLYWGVLQADFLNSRADNPRNVEQTLRIRRGQIVDTQEVVLAYNDGTPDRQVRVYPLPAAEPVVGYYSLRHGTAGVEQALDLILTGAAADPWLNHWRAVLNRPQVGQDVRLTIDIGLQANTAQLLKGKQGTAILMGLPGGAIRVMASMPTYDPNTLDEQFENLVDQDEAPLVNRAVQGVYQPGKILVPFLTAAALDAGDLIPSEIEAGLDPDDILDRLGRRWLSTHLVTAWSRFRFDQAPDIQLPVQEPAELAINDFQNALQGEDLLTVTPLQIAIAASALGNEGQLATPRLVSAVHVDDRWQAFAESDEPQIQIISSEMASEVLRSLTISQENIAEWETVVQSGPDSLNTWYVGLFPANDPRFVAVVVLENEADPRIGREIGRRMMTLTLK